MIALFTDFGLEGPYTGQVKAVLYGAAPAIPVIDLFADAPAADPRAASYLLAAYAEWFPAGTVVLAVVDPGVGTDRTALAVVAAGRWYVGPDNGLFELVRRRDPGSRAFAITWHPPALSASFHGRDLFAPVAARLALSEAPPGEPLPLDGGFRRAWPDDLAEIVYVDRYGNAMTGLRAGLLEPGTRLRIAGRELDAARTFADRPPGEAFWYANANGLVEIAVNRGRADRQLGLAIGSPLAILA